MNQFFGEHQMKLLWSPIALKIGNLELLWLTTALKPQIKSHCLLGDDSRGLDEENGCDLGHRENDMD